MENKKKPKTTLKEVRKKMKKLTIAEKKQIKQTETKDKEKKEANKQKITQRVRVNVNIPNSLTQPQSGNFPNSFYNREQNTLLKSINEQLKQKNEPVANATQNFNIPQPRQTDEPSPIPTSTGIKIEQNQDDNEEILKTNLSREFIKLRDTIKNIPPKPILKDTLEGMPPQFSEKVSPPPVITPNKIPIVNKPKESSGLSLFEQIKQKEEEQIPRTEEQVLQLDEEIKRKVGRTKLTEEQKQENLRNLRISEQIKEEKRQQAKEKKERKLMEDEENYQKQQDKKQKKEEIERNKLLESRRKANEKNNEKQQISNKAFDKHLFVILLRNSDVGDLKDLQEAYDRGFLTDKAIQEKLKKLKYTPAEINRMFSKPK